MKKLSLILAGALLLGGISFASPVAKQQPAKANSTKTVKAVKPAVKKDSAKPATGKKGGSVKKGAPVKQAAK